MELMIPIINWIICGIVLTIKNPPVEIVLVAIQIILLIAQIIYLHYKYKN